MRATSEVAYPVIGATLTTLAAFAPMLYWPGIMGEFMSYLPLTLIITLTASLFVALVINPALASLFMEEKKRGSVDRKALNAALSVENPVVIDTFLLKRYSGLLRFSLERPLVIVTAAFAVLVLMVQGWLLVIGLEKPVEFFPEIEPKGMYVNIETPEGADLEYIDRMMQRLEMAVAGADARTVAADGFSREAYGQALAPKSFVNASGLAYTGPSDLENIKTVYMKGVVSAPPGSAFDPNTPSHIGVRFLDLQDRKESSHATVDTIRKRVEDIPGGKVTIAMEAEGPPTGAPINIEIAGDDFAVLGAIAKKIKLILAELPQVKDVRDDFNEGTPSVQVRVDRQKAALFEIGRAHV